MLPPPALLTGLAATTAGCGGNDRTVAATSGIDEAFRAAHPEGALPASLRGSDVSRPQIARRVAAVVEEGTPILLPRRLPRGFRLAAPYIAVGDGSARPNPEGWGRSYRVSYTDGRGLLVVTVGARRLPGGVAWSPARRTLRGRALRAGRSATTAVVATVRGRPLIVVTGERVPLARLVDVTAGLAP